MTDELEELREEVARIDAEVATLIAKRFRTVEAIGRIKGGRRIPVRDRQIEERVAQRLEAMSRDQGLSSGFGRDLARLLIEESVRVQDATDRPAVDEGRRVLVVGGAGRMGSWLCRYFRGQGERVAVNDIAGPLDGFPFAADLEGAAQDAEVIALATPISAAASVLRDLIKADPDGLVFDVCSLKAPIRMELEQAAADGMAVTSVHPLFGPSVGSLAGRNILFCDCGNRGALDRAMDVFRGTGANLHEASLDRHDALMARILGLSHATNILFFNALARGPFAANELELASSTTFERQVAAARSVAGENPDLYFEIQALNPHTEAVLRDLEASLADLREAVLRGDADAFRSLMDTGRRFFGGE